MKKFRDRYVIGWKIVEASYKTDFENEVRGFPVFSINKRKTLWSNSSCGEGKMKKKIGFLGSQGTGKTTIAYELACELKKQGKDVYVLSEVARSLNRDATEESQRWIFGKQLTREQSCKAEYLVSDRTLLDPIAYALLKFPDEFVHLKPYTKHYMKSYEHVVYLPPNDAYLLEDGIRSIDKLFRDEVDAMVLSLVKEFGIKTKSYKEILDYYEIEEKKDGRIE